MIYKLFSGTFSKGVPFEKLSIGVMYMKKILAIVLVLALLVVSVPIGTLGVNAAAAKTAYAVGDIVEFGSYKQSAIKNANGETIGFNVEPLKWRILKIENGKALLFTEEVIDNKYYNSTSATVDGYYGNNYAHSDIREWLINDFYNTAFSSAEKTCIVATTLDNSAAPTSYNASGSYTKYSSESTTDKVFLLSKDEANTYASKYFRTTATDYAISLGYQLYSGAGSVVGDNWTLRTAGNNTYQIYTVHVRWGEHVTYFNWYDDTITTPRGVRPAIYVDLDNFQENVNTNALTINIKQKIGNIDLGPYALKGATINVAGYEISLIDIEANLSLNIGENIKITSDTNGIIKVLIGFDQDASANLSGEKNSTNYWSESYQEVKSMYQDLTGNKVDTTRLWNKFSSLRGKLRRNNASMIVDVDSSLIGYAEFRATNDGIEFSEGGVVAQFEANTSVRTYPYPFVYLALGLGVNAKGELVFTNENGQINPSITVSPSFRITAGGGIGTRSTYAQIDAYGTLSANISTNSSVPFEAGIDLGARWMGYIFGKEIFSGAKSFASMELYPNLGDAWPVMLMCTEPDVNVDNVDSYMNLLDSSTPISRNYLASTYSLRSNLSTDGTDFLKRNAYPLSSPELVRFDDDTMLLVWIDDTGEKTIENRCSLMYSYFDGTEWSSPATVYEDGMNADMPSVYSDGTYAYIVWQKATCVFDETVETSEMLEHYDLYTTVFDSRTLTFSEKINLNSGDDTAFEFSPVVYGSAGNMKVAWIENSDNNVYQMSGENSLYTVSIDTEGSVSDVTEVIVTYDVFKGIDICNNGVVYSLYESESNNLYLYTDAAELIANGINSFDCANGKIFYFDATGFHSYDDIVTDYAEFGTIDEFTVSYCNGKYALFTTVLNEDFSKSLCYTTMTEDNALWSNMELYYGIGTYIRDYSPVTLSDGTVHVAFNHVTFDSETDDETAMIQIGQCTDDVNISLEYVDFDDDQLSDGSIDLLMNVSNHSSTKIKSLDVIIEDHNGYVAYSGTIELPLDAFSNSDFSVNYTIPEEYNDEVYTVKVTPTDYWDYDESDNKVGTTFQCVHINSDNWVVEVYPSSNVDGMLVQKCLVCNKILEEKEIPRLNFSGASLTLQDDMVINYKVNETLFTENGYTNPYVIFSLNGVDTKVTEYTTENGKYIFDFEDIIPHQMNDTIYATLYATYNGVEYASETREYSVATYCYNMLEKYNTSEYAELQTLLVDLLNYGAASQVYMDYKTDNLVNANLTEEQKAWGTSTERTLETVQDLEYKTIENSTVQWKGGGLNLQKSVGMRFKITADNIENLNVKVTNDIGEETIITSDAFEATEGGYYVFFEGLNAGQMSDVVYLTVYDGDTAVSNTIRYSIESYAYAKQNSADTNLAELVKSMMRYGDSAKAYVS